MNQRWFIKFREGSLDLQDFDRYGRQIVVDDNVLRSIIEEKLRQILDVLIGEISLA